VKKRRSSYVHTYTSKERQHPVPVTYFSPPLGKESLIKARGWDKCVVRCILKRSPTRPALNTNSFRCCFASANCLFPSLSQDVIQLSCRCSLQRSEVSGRLHPSNVLGFIKRNSREKESKRDRWIDRPQASGNRKPFAKPFLAPLNRWDLAPGKLVSNERLLNALISDSCLLRFAIILISATTRPHWSSFGQQSSLI